MNLAERNHADQEALELAHGRLVNEVNDRAITLQDAAYELGRKRGKAEADAELLAALKDSVALMDVAGVSDQTLNSMRAVIAKVEGGAS